MRPEARALLGDARALITDDWLAKIGFKWHQFHRQPHRHWLLWLGSALTDRGTCYEDLGLEISFGPCGSVRDPNEHWYFAWVRSDAAGRYHRFLHIRRLRTRGDLLDLLHGLTGVHFDPDNAWYGHLCTPEQAARNRAEYERIDLKMARDWPWHESEKDDTKGGPLIEHMRVADEALKKKGEGK